MSVDAARTAAYDIVRQVSDDGAYVNLVIPRVLREHQLSGRDAAFVTELVSGAVRLRGTYDAIIDSLASHGIERIDPPVLDALRLGAHQLLSMRVPDHAAVTTTVELVRRHVGHKPVGFTNAILRRIGRRDLDTWLSEVTKGLDDDDALAVRFSHPRWIVRELREALPDPAQLVDLLAADNAAPKVTLVARPGLADPEELPGVPGKLSPYARILESGGMPGDIPAVRDGRAGVQDEGSQLVAITSAASPVEGRDERWLDLCAGPGGKSALWAALAAGRGARVVANELQRHRADLVRQAVRALDNVEVTVHDGRRGPWEPGSFDRVLVDAPCTGLGALRRRPESRWRRTTADLDDLVALQGQLLARAIELTRPGGVVAYATCSPVVAETRAVVDAALQEHEGLVLESMQQWWPHIDGTDAMFLALLRRR
ncbi:rRNA cytosine-C5-methyltransferase [Aeromicrobium phragmitis]|uniref:rRNA cytosine-C5-methyltransferase n=1 Tax=Aeromicrobium phragmitis TaxID=2478914 RepID=A0A3L8PJ39_9ACTN|nr:transcription antitermination factor NusB [Aeromicrobium phragmitis]RLV55436.1 rRNA cytosine-C5-methyltransferase [Aeromicrobium phragmitis]